MLQPFEVLKGRDFTFLIDGDRVYFGDLDYKNWKHLVDIDIDPEHILTRNKLVYVVPGEVVTDGFTRSMISFIILGDESDKCESMRISDILVYDISANMYCNYMFALVYIKKVGEDEVLYPINIRPYLKPKNIGPYLKPKFLNGTLQIHRIPDDSLNPSEDAPLDFLVTKLSNINAMYDISTSKYQLSPFDNMHIDNIIKRFNGGKVNTSEDRYKYILENKVEYSRCLNQDSTRSLVIEDFYAIKERKSDRSYFIKHLGNVICNNKPLTVISLTCLNKIIIEFYLILVSVDDTNTIKEVYHIESVKRGLFSITSNDLNIFIRVHNELITVAEIPEKFTLDFDKGETIYSKCKLRDIFSSIYLNDSYNIELYQREII
jgi:hypothetical protein